ncbi:hypothetical protein IW148_004689 [Coemansia sp. RSA 1199]|nr:hypothetical protein IW148_004689 [Coemansia sp. RSA 1199]
MDGKQYGHYKQLSGRCFDFDGFSLTFDSIQTDAYAPPSRIRLRVDQKAAKFPATCYSIKMRAIACVHYLSQHIHKVLAELQNGQTSRGGSGGWHSAKGGEVAIDCPGQEILERTSAVISDRMVEARLTAGLPAAGRTILASAAQRMFLETLPRVVERALMYRSVDSQAMHALAASVEDQEYLRSQLESLGLVAFIGNGAVLPRVSGVSNMPLATNTVVRFQAPPELQVMVELPNQGAVVGMGIRQGVTLICGGGFNGKSTLLQAIERGVYNHAPGDGRELVVTDATATKIKAEEGRFVCSTDIRPFINNLPLSKTTGAFSTANASGSTSMAASIQEAVEVEASTLLFDEDTCATNFLVRDGRMQQLVSQDCEPITPLVSRVRELWEAKGVSSIMVIGGCGDYLDVADTVVSMHGYVPSDATKKAKDIARRMPVVIEIPQIKYGPALNRTIIVPKELAAHKPPKAKTRWSIALFPSDKLSSLAPPATSGVGADAHERTDEPEVFPELDLTALDQLVSVSQTRAIASMLQLATQNARRRTMRSLVSDMCTTALGDLPAGHGVAGNLARPRGIEVALAINRLRYAQIQP